MKNQSAGGTSVLRASGAGRRLDEMRRRSGLSIDVLARRIGFAGASSLQRYLRPDRATLPFELVERLAPILVGKGEPPILREEIYALSGIAPAPENGTNGRARHGGEIEIARGVVDIGYMEQDLPIYGRADADADDAYLFGEDAEILALTTRPTILANVRDAYALYMRGESMLPRYRLGEMLFVDPVRPAASGDDVVVRLKDGTGYVKQLVRRTGSIILCHQHNPDSDIEYPARDVRAIHLIVASTRIRT